MSTEALDDKTVLPVVDTQITESERPDWYPEYTLFDSDDADIRSSLNRLLNEKKAEVESLTFFEKLWRMCRFLRMRSS